MKLSSAVGGLAGACALSVINESVKKIDKSGPHVDLLGMNATAKLLQKDKKIQPLENKISPASFMSDLISNSLYYGMAGGRTKNQTLLRGALLGLGAGLGAVTLPKTFGIDEVPAGYTLKTKVFTVVWYVLGGLVAAATINALEKK